MILEKITIIIPAYNSSQYLNDALESVVNQRLPDYEIIVVDDGSTESENKRLKEILANYDHAKLATKKNGGAASARNFGAKNATGKYLAFLDSDDIWLENKINSQLQILKNDNDVGLVVGNIVVADDKLKVKYKAYKYIPDDGQSAIRDFFQGRIVMNTPTILLRREIFEENGGFPEDLQYREDHYFLMMIAKSSKIVCDEKCLTVRRERAGSLSSVGDVYTELGKHTPFWIKSQQQFPFLNIEQAKKNLLIKLFIFYLRNDRKKDIEKITSYIESVDKKYFIAFTLMSKTAWAVKFLYNFRNKIKNARL